MGGSLTRFGNGREDNLILDGFLALADDWIAHRTGETGIAWFRASIEAVAHAADDRALATAIGLAPRRLGKADLSLGAEEMARASAVRANFDPGDWSIDQVARVALMIASHNGDDAAFAARFDAFCATAELNELIALCRGLPLYPGAALIEPRAREAVRSGMKPVFEAVAHRNPYPGEMFGEDAWNHMVVKAFFIGSWLWPIHGLDRRGNPRLARMLVDLANERRAAGRPVSAEVWRCVAPHADAQGVAALTHAFVSGSHKDRLAVTLAARDAAASGASLDFSSVRDDIARLQQSLAADNTGWRDLA